MPQAEHAQRTVLQLRKLLHPVHHLLITGEDVGLAGDNDAGTRRASARRPFLFVDAERHQPICGEFSVLLAGFVAVLLALGNRRVGVLLAGFVAILVARGNRGVEVLSARLVPLLIVVGVRDRGKIARAASRPQYALANQAYALARLEALVPFQQHLDDAPVVETHDELFGMQRDFAHGLDYAQLPGLGAGHAAKVELGRRVRRGAGDLRGAKQKRDQEGRGDPDHRIRFGGGRSGGETGNCGRGAVRSRPRRLHAEQDAAVAAGLLQGVARLIHLRMLRRAGSRSMSDFLAECIG